MRGPRIGWRSPARVGALAIALASVGAGAMTGAGADELDPVKTAAELAARHDNLGLRTYLHQVGKAKLLNDAEWAQLRALLFRNSAAGYDLVYAWDRVRVGKTPAATEWLNRSFATADSLMLRGRFSEAYSQYEVIARALRKRTTSAAAKADAAYADNLRLLYPYTLHAMARALYGAGRYHEALKVYTWIPRGYARFRQTQFEKMWAAFRDGNVDYALGAVASQASAYFSRYIEPEAYLVEIYLFRRLCRDADAKAVRDEIKAFLAALKSGAYGVREWARSDVETATLLALTEAPDEPDVPGVSQAERRAEKISLTNRLTRAFDADKKRLTEELNLVSAYSNLALQPGASAALKPIAKLPSREKLMKMDLEIWPADSGEQWADEMGGQRFLGESRCGVKK